MKVIFIQPIKDSDENEEFLTVTVTSDPENVTLEFTDENGDNENFNKLLLSGEMGAFVRLDDAVPGSKGVFDAKKLEHWKNIQCLFHSPYLYCRVEE